MGKYRKLEDWKSELVSRVFEFLTVFDVVQIVNKDNHKRYVALCKCKCGNECQIDVYSLTRGHVKSCGCYEKSKENSDRHKEINKNNRQLRSESRKKWCQTNPDKLKEIGLKRSQWCKENQDRVKEASDKFKEWQKSNKDKVRDSADKYKQWRINNPDKVASMIAKQKEWHTDKTKQSIANAKRKETLLNNPSIRQRLSEARKSWCKDNPDKLRESVEKRKQFFKDHPDELEKISSKLSDWAKDNPDKICEIGSRLSAKYVADRLSADYSKLIDVIDPEFIDDLLSGKLTSDSIIRTRCPICGKHDHHSFHNVFTLSKEDFRNGKAPMCSECSLSYSSSQYETEIAELISTFYSGELIRNDRSVLNGKELDLYYPEKKIAVEFNGDYWHSSKFKSKSYHYEKYLECKSKGILLISIFEYNWIRYKDTIIRYVSDTFNGMSNELSYTRCHYMNNSYPDINRFSELSNKVIESFYQINDINVYTCGFTALGDKDEQRFREA